MNLDFSHNSLCINEIIFDAVVEHSMELDYLLPDYYSSIFKIIKYRATPKITSKRISAGKLIIDGVICYKIIYVSENDYKICSITQKQPFSKTIDIKRNSESSDVLIHIAPSYLNCRVVNPMRTDLRGAFSMHIIIKEKKRISVLSEAKGMGLQTDKREITAIKKYLSTSKEFTIHEELEIPSTKSSISDIVEYTAPIVVNETKIIANKVIVKGEILLHTLYSIEENNVMEVMDYSIPISQIVDMAEINEEYNCTSFGEIISAEFSFRQDANGESRIIDANFLVKVDIESCINGEAFLIRDAFSTQFYLNSTIENIRTENLIERIDKIHICKDTVDLPSENYCCIYDVLNEFITDNISCENGYIKILGKHQLGIILLDEEKIPQLIEKVVPCEISIPLNSVDEDCSFIPDVSLINCSYNLPSGTSVAVQTEIRICGNVYRESQYNIINNIEIDEKEKNRNEDATSLRLYFGEKGERIWNIAKRFNTSVKAIYEENELEGDQLTHNGLILIPQIK